MLHIKNQNTLSKINNNIISVEDIFKNQITDKVIFNTDIIKNIHYTFHSKMAKKNEYYHIEIDKEWKIKYFMTILDDTLDLYRRLIGNTKITHKSSKQEIATYIAKTYSLMLFLHPFSTGNEYVALILVNLLLMRHNKKRIDFISLIRNSNFQHSLDLCKDFDSNLDYLAEIFEEFL